MKILYTAILASILLYGCAAVPIARVSFPDPTVLSGFVTEIDEGGFVLKDATGQIDVDTDDVSFEDKLKIGDKVTVKGVLDEDDSVGKAFVMAEEFDAYAVILPNGREVMIVPYRTHPQSGE